MAIVKNLRDHEVYFTPFDVIGKRVIDDYPTVTVGAGETVEVPDPCAYGAPEVNRLGLVYEDSGWELVGPAKKAAKRARARTAAGDGAEKTAVEVPPGESAELTGDGSGEALAPIDGEDA